MTMVCFILCTRSKSVNRTFSFFVLSIVLFVGDSVLHIYIPRKTLLRVSYVMLLIYRFRKTN